MTTLKDVPPPGVTPAAAEDSRWIQTFTGRQFWPLAPRACDVGIEDVAHALSLKCRFTGHCREFYSVAQHSYFVSSWVPPEDALWGLLHDAAEAYLPDVARPVKRELAGFKGIEDCVMRVVAERFSLPWPEPASIKAADLRALATERRDLMTRPPVPWISVESVEPDPMRISPWSPPFAKMLFLARFCELTKE